MTVLTTTERDAVADQFGVATQQIERDYVLSLLLAVLAEQFADDLIFFGGTALARAHLPAGRLSEDLDLIAVGSRSALAPRLDSVLPRAVQRDYGRLSWQQPLSAVRDVDPAVLTDGDGLTIKVQLLRQQGYSPWPTEKRELTQRYRDVRAATLRVPTLPAFAAWKTAAWFDRHAPRDLWDLWALSDLGAINADAAALYRRYGPTGGLPQTDIFTTPPSQAEWQAQLGQQTRLSVTAEQALDVVRCQWGEVVGQP